MTLFRSLRSLLSSGVAPIIPGKDHPAGQDYRLPGDQPRMIRVDQKPRKGLTEKFRSHIEIAGTSYPGIRENAESFIRGTNRRLSLEKLDSIPPAIKVIGVWMDRLDRGRVEQIGWVPNVVVDVIAREVADDQIGATIETMFRGGNDFEPAISIVLWHASTDIERIRH